MHYSTEGVRSVDQVIAKMIPIPDAVAEVMAKYREIVDGNKSDTWDTHRAVAFDTDGLWGVWGEVIETAAQLGYSVEDDDVKAAPFVAALVEAAKEYQAELRGKLA